MTEPDQNPFQSPADYGEIITPEQPGLQRKPVKPPVVLIKWAAICAVSAAPSFVFGLMIGNAQLNQIIAMLVGVIIFIFAYTAVECSSPIQHLMRRKLVRIAARVGYGTRLFISVVFPIGCILDMPTGMVSITVASFLFGADFSSHATVTSPLFSFTWYLSTTIIQGILLNIILLIYMTVVFGIGLLFTNADQE